MRKSAIAEMIKKCQEVRRKSNPWLQKVGLKSQILEIPSPSGYKKLKKKTAKP